MHILQQVQEPSNSLCPVCCSLVVGWYQWDFIMPDLMGCIVHYRNMLLLFHRIILYPHSSIYFQLSFLCFCLTLSKTAICLINIYVTVATTCPVVSQGDLPRLFVCITFVLKQSPAQSLSVIFNSGT